MNTSIKKNNMNNIMRKLSNVPRKHVRKELGFSGAVLWQNDE